MLLIVTLGVVGVLVASGIYLYLDGRRDAMRERLTLGLEQEDRDAPSIWKDASNLLRLAQVQALLERSPLARTLARRLRQCAVPVSLLNAIAGAVLVASAMAGLAHLLLPGTGASVGAFAGVLLLGWGGLYLWSRHVIRKLEMQLPSFINQMIATLRAGGTPLVAMRNAARTAPQPIASSMQSLIRNMELGVPANQAWYDWAEGWDSNACRLLSTALRIKWEAGGEMSAILEFVLEALETRRRMELRVETRTSLARVSTYFMTAWPIVMGLIFYSLNPALYIEALEHPIGIALAQAMVVLLVIGYLWIRRISRLQD